MAVSKGSFAVNRSAATNGGSTIHSGPSRLDGSSGSISGRSGQCLELRQPARSGRPSSRVKMAPKRTQKVPPARPDKLRAILGAAELYGPRWLEGAFMSILQRYFRYRQHLPSFGLRTPENALEH